METKLKPCPFCGGSAAYVHEVISRDDHFYYAKCVICECRTAEYLTKESAVEMWNTRECENN